MDSKFLKFSEIQIQIEHYEIRSKDVNFKSETSVMLVDAKQFY